MLFLLGFLIINVGSISAILRIKKKTLKNNILKFCNHKYSALSFKNQRNTTKKLIKQVNYAWGKQLMKQKKKCQKLTWEKEKSPEK